MRRSYISIDFSDPQPLCNKTLHASMKLHLRSDSLQLGRAVFRISPNRGKYVSHLKWHEMHFVLFYATEDISRIYFHTTQMTEMTSYFLNENNSPGQ
jgi:hypothetical protein